MINTQHHHHVVELAVFGEFTLADFKEFEELVLYEIKFAAPINLLVDLRDMADFTLDVAWEEIKFMRDHGSEFNRVAVVTDDEWQAWGAWVSNLFNTANVTVFHDYEDAEKWVSEGE